MDHRYIDDHSLADRYLDRVLAPRESGEFEAHLVDCQECRDRLLLAEMFHARNGGRKPRNGGRKAGKLPDSARPRVVAGFSAKKIVLFFGAAAAVASVSAALFLWVLRR